MGTRLLLLCLWIISTLVIADNLTDEENKERSEKCGFTNSDANKTLLVRKDVYWETRISQRHTVANPNYIPNFDDVECRKQNDLADRFNDAVKATFVGDCGRLRGIVLVEYNNEEYESYACLPHKELNIGDHAIAYNKELNPHDVTVKDCSIPGWDHLCFDTQIKDFEKNGGPVFVKAQSSDGDDHYTLYGTGFWDRPGESVAVSIFRNLNGICSVSGICAVPEATTTETPETTTSEEVTTTPTPTESSTESSTEPSTTLPTIPTDSTESTVELTSPPATTTPEPVTVPGTTTIETSTRKVTKKRRKTTTAPSVKDPKEDITKGCGDEYLCWEEDLFDAAGSISLLVAIIVVLIVFYW